jgi:hypothetical protein
MTSFKILNIWFYKVRICTIETEVGMLILLVKIECKSAPLKKGPYFTTLMMKTTAAVKEENNISIRDHPIDNTILGYV